MLPEIEYLRKTMALYKKWADDKKKLDWATQKETGDKCPLQIFNLPWWCFLMFRLTLKVPRLDVLG
jgi:hypothetical protein